MLMLFSFLINQVNKLKNKNQEKDYSVLTKNKKIDIKSFILMIALIIVLVGLAVVLVTYFAPYPMNRPKGYGLFHLCFVVISIALMIAFCIPMRKCSDKTFRIVMFSTGLVLLGAELYKHFYYAFIIDKVGEEFLFPSQKYEWDIFSFQLCSVPMYLAVVIGLMKEGKVRNALCEYMVSIGFLGGIMAYVEPSGILHAEAFCTLHSSIWHGLLIFMALFIIFTNKSQNFNSMR